MGTAYLVGQALPQAKLRVGFSWSSLSKALGEPADASQWAVLYLGTKVETKGVSGMKPFQLLSRKGTAMSDKGLRGIVLLDGNWKQSKTLWWRNPWLLKLNRAVLKPSEPSLFGTKRRQPRRECLSTLESVAESLAALESGNPAPAKLREILTKHLTKVETSRAQSREVSGAPALP